MSEEVKEQHCQDCHNRQFKKCIKLNQFIARKTPICESFEIKSPAHYPYAPKRDKCKGNKAGKKR